MTWNGTKEASRVGPIQHERNENKRKIYPVFFTRFLVLIVLYARTHARTHAPKTNTNLQQLQQPQQHTHTHTHARTHARTHTKNKHKPPTITTTTTTTTHTHTGSTHTHTHTHTHTIFIAHQGFSSQAHDSNAAQPLRTTTLIGTRVPTAISQRANWHAPTFPSRQTGTRQFGTKDTASLHTAPVWRLNSVKKHNY